jgi:hypothetical protein
MTCSEDYKFSEMHDPTPPDRLKNPEFVWETTTLTEELNQLMPRHTMPFGGSSIDTEKRQNTDSDDLIQCLEVSIAILPCKINLR